MQERGAEKIQVLMNQIKIIPDYQRDFVWSANELTKFFEDILEEWNDAKPKTEKNYFIGSIVFEKKPGTSPQEFYLVDGQQRVTSLYLFISLAPPKSAPPLGVGGELIYL